MLTMYKTAWYFILHTGQVNTSRHILCKLYNILCRRTTFSPLTQTTALTVSAMLLDHMATSVTQLQDSVAVGVVSLVGGVTPAPIHMLRLLCVVVRVRHCSSLPPYLFFLKLLMRNPSFFSGCFQMCKK